LDGLDQVLIGNGVHVGRVGVITRWRFEDLPGRAVALAAIAMAGCTRRLVQALAFGKDLGRDAGL
jgi:hypothetical protein